MSSRKAKKRPVEAPTAALKAAAAPPAPPAWLERHSLVLTLALILFASLRIGATYAVFDHTSEEPSHIACGREWVDREPYPYGAHPPPWARIAAALGPYLLGIR